MVPEPNTWKEVVEAVASRPERLIAVQEYGRPNPEMTAALEALGAHVTPFAITVGICLPIWTPCARRHAVLASRVVDVVLFTSSIQLDHLFQIARQQGIETEVGAALEQYCGGGVRRAYHDGRARSRGIARRYSARTSEDGGSG